MYSSLFAYYYLIFETFLLSFIICIEYVFFIDSNRQEIKRIIPDSKLTKALIDENIYMIQALQFKAYIKNKIKASLKKLLK